MTDLRIDQIQHAGDTQIRVQLDLYAVNDYVRAMQDGETFPPVDIFFDGDTYWLADGFHRVESTKRLGRDTIAATIHQGGKRDAILFAIDTNQRYGVRLSNKDKQNMVKMFLTDEVWAEWSDREIGRRCGVDHKTVSAHRESIWGISPDTTSRKSRRNGKDYTIDTTNIGKPAPVEPDPPQSSMFDEPEPEEPQPEPERDQDAANVQEAQTELAQASGQLEDADEAEPTPHKMAVHFSSETPEHYTPEHILSMVIEVMGRIDLDPCSNSKTDPHVPATYHYTAEDDGLALPWCGSVFLNPPYGRVIGEWVTKLVGEFETGEVAQAIALVPARTDTAWWDKLTSCGRTIPLVCFVQGRLTFIGNDDPAPFPSALIYLGDNRTEFYSVFSSIGCVWVQWNDELSGVVDYGSI